MKDKQAQLLIVELSTAEDTIKRNAIRVFVDSFYELYTSLSKEKSVLNEFFISSFDEKLVYAAVKENKVLGMLAIANGKERSLKFKKEKCIQLFGKIKGRIVYYEMNYMFGKPNLECEKDIGIDYLATEESSRGIGVATQMLEYACDHLCYEECYIDVAERNTVAKRLYEHVGFKEYARDHSLVTRMLGFRSIIRMKKRVK